MDVLPHKEFRRLDLNAEELGVPVAKLMERAGKALARTIRAHTKSGPVLLLCGKGNNGGDGFAAAAALLRQGLEVRVVLLEAADAVRSAAARAFLEALPKQLLEPWRPRPPAAWRDAAVVVDCMLGSGIQGSPRPPYDGAIHWMNRHQGHRIACDIPSGLGTPVAVRPAATVTFHAAKQGMTPLNSGTITVAPIGIPAQARLEVGLGDLEAGFRRAASDSHKGDNGRVLVVGGGPFLGAPYYAGMAAYRTGADLVHVATPTDAAAALRTWGPELLVHEAGPDASLTEESIPSILALLPRVDSVVLGPGIGVRSETREAARTLLDSICKIGLPVVVDADGLDALDDTLLATWGRQLVLTPHGKEFQDLTGRAPTAANVTRFAKKFGVTVLRKGTVDVISDGHQTRRCTRGDPTMTVGGTGDLLAGIVAALLARGAEPFDAACAGAYLLGRAGEETAKRLGPGALSSDMLIEIAHVLAATTQ